MINPNKLIATAATMVALGGTGEVAPAAEKSVEQQHLEYCTNLHAGNTDTLDNQTGEQKPDGIKDGLPSEHAAGYQFISAGRKAKISVDPQNLAADFRNCNDVKIVRTAIAKIYDKRGKSVRTIGHVTFTLDSKGTAQEKTAAIKRPRGNSTNFMKLFVTAQSGDYTASSVVRTEPVESYK